MKQYGKLTVLTVCFIVCLCLLFPGRILAAGRIDTGRDCSLTIYCQEKDKPLEDVLFWIYRVADADETGELTATSYFTDYNVDIRGKNDEAWMALASTLEGLVLRDKLSPIERKKTDAGGAGQFSRRGYFTETGAVSGAGQRPYTGRVCVQDFSFYGASSGTEYGDQYMGI